MNDFFEIAPLADVVEEVCESRKIIAKSISDIIKQIENSDCAWTRLEDWEGMSDTEIFQLLAAATPPSGMLTIVSEASYRKNLGAFKVPGNNVNQFVAEHHAKFGECLFNGDVFIFSKSQAVIWLFHHEGVFAVFQ